MTDDLVVRLRCYPANRLCRQVADALEAKDARIAELEAHLDRCSAWMETYGEDGHEPQLFQEIIRQARAALGEKNDNE